MDPRHSPAPPCAIDRAINACAREHHEILEDEQLWAAGLTYEGKRTRVARRILQPIGRGLNVYGSGAVTTLGRARIGERAGGSGAFATEWLALRARGVTDFDPARVVVITPHRRRDFEHDELRVRFRRTSRFADDEHSAVEGVEIATACRAIFDLARTVDTERLVRLLREASFRRVGSVDELERIARRYPRTPNGARCVEVVRRYREGAGGSRSRSEAEIFAAIQHCWIVPARLNQPSGVYLDDREIELDVSWEGHPLVLELDGGDHLDVNVAREDARKARALRKAGYIPFHVLNTEFELRFDEALADLVATLERHAPPGYREAVARGTVPTSAAAPD